MSDAAGASSSASPHGAEKVERRLGWVTVDGTQYPRHKAKDWQDAVAQGLCPFCGAGPFSVVAIHVTRVHAIDRREFRDLLGVTYETSLCDPDHAERMSRNATRNFENGLTLRVRPPVGGKKRLSIAAREIQRAKALSQTAESRRQGGALSSSRRLSAAADRDRRALELASQGMSRREIAETLGIAETTVYEIAKRSGRQGLFRFTYNLKMRNQGDRDSLKRGRDAHIANARARQDRLTQDYESGTPLDVIAEREGVTIKSLRQTFRRWGVVVPDGRTEIRADEVTLTCPWCGQLFTRRASVVRNNAKRFPAEPCCSKSCSAKRRSTTKPPGRPSP